jgi:hypothetical protein
VDGAGLLSGTFGSREAPDRRTTVAAAVGRMR